MEQEKILRINELAKKKKEVGLTDEETRERSTRNTSRSFASRRKRRSSAFASSRRTAAISRWSKKKAN